jgi:hypothetical protein
VQRLLGEHCRWRLQRPPLGLLCGYVFLPTNKPSTYLARCFLTVSAVRLTAQVDLYDPDSMSGRGLDGEGLWMLYEQCLPEWACEFASLHFGVTQASPPSR